MNTKHNGRLAELQGYLRLLEEFETLPEVICISEFDAKLQFNWQPGNARMIKAGNLTIRVSPLLHQGEYVQLPTLNFLQVG